MRWLRVPVVDPFLGAERILVNSASADPSSLRAGLRPRLVIFSDYACSYCRQLDSLLESHPQVTRRFEVSWRHAPIIGEQLSRTAAKMVICEGMVLGTAGAHSALFRTRRTISDAIDSLRSAFLASDISSCMDSEEAAEVLARDLDAASALGIHATPAIMVDSMLFRGLPADIISRLVNIADARPKPRHSTTQ